MFKWKKRRRLPPLHFLAEPNVLDGVMTDRMVLVGRRRDEPVGLLVASPIRARHGYQVELLARSADAPNGSSELLIDAAMTAGAANTESVRMLMRAGPFGAGNPEPVIALPTHSLIYVEEVGQAHARVRLRAGDGSVINGIAFRAAGQPLGTALARARGTRVHAAGNLCIDQWNGTERVQLRIIDVAAAS